MKEIITFIEAKELIKQKNVIIYGSVRDIQTYFMQSFTNIDILAELFNNIMIIIFENDSTDNTRKMLQSWKLQETTKVKKHLILESDLDKIFPLRATRLAYCRNKILEYIFQNNLDNTYEYAIHADLDDRFWCIDYEGLINCFQYDSSEWDVMTSVGKNKSYYDYWALRVESTWFNKNIFSCHAEGIDFTTKTNEFVKLLKNTNGLLNTSSSFNGLGIYKLCKLKNARYNASYNCPVCFNRNRGCFEDNDHIGLHNSLNKNNGKLFINTKMEILSKQINTPSYEDFIVHYFSNITNLNMNPLLYVLENKLIKTNLWLDIGTNNGDVANIMSKHTNQTIFSIKLNKIKNTLNPNVTILNKTNYLNEITNKHISFVSFNIHYYLHVKSFLKNIYNKLQNDCIIVFDKCINYRKYVSQSLKAFYEMVYEHNMEFEIIGMNGVFVLSQEHGNFVNDIFDIKTNQMISIRITKNPSLIKIIQNPIPKPISNPIPKPISTSYDKFDWKTYVFINKDLQKCMDSLEKCWNHFKTIGIHEDRKVYFNWKKYIKDYPVVNDKSYALEHAKSKNTLKNYSINFSFNVESNNKLIKKYNKIYDNIIPLDFNWVFYLVLNNDILENDDNFMNNYEKKMLIEKSFMHWINKGYKEKNRIYNIL